jgi:hypothetical protein
MGMVMTSPVPWCYRLHRGTPALAIIRNILRGIRRGLQPGMLYLFEQLKVVSNKLGNKR